MKPNKIFIGLALAAVLVFAGCDTTPGTSNNTGSVGGSADNVVGGTDGDGFVRFPGEPSRGDSSYYIVEDVCGQFTEKFVAGITGKTIAKVKLAEYDPQYTCTYYTSFDEAKGYGPFFSIALTYLSVENQKKGHEALGRTVKTDPKIKMDHFISIQEDGLINGIYLVLGPNKFISLNRSSGKVMTEDEMINFAVKLADKIKNFK
jgi:hypothetical protein